jgi:hypothetical protein
VRDVPLPRSAPFAKRTLTFVFDMNTVYLDAMIQANFPRLFPGDD